MTKGGTMIDKLMPFLNDGELVEEMVKSDGKNVYIMPARRNAGHVAIVLVREIVAPTVFRNAEEEITDIEDGAGVRRVRATPSKFKFGERGRGLLVLRAFGVGGRMPQNRTAVGNLMPVRDALDLNTLVFGDSTMQGNQVLPVKAAVQYSDALSVAPYGDCVGESFHHRGDESGTLWDPEDKKNTDNLFSRHFVRPGTLLVQVLTCNGRQLPRVGFDHLLLSLGLAGSYGGQTSVTGVNVRSHIVGVFGARFEKAVASPYELVRRLSPECATAEIVAHEVSREMADDYGVGIDHEEASAYQRSLIDAFENDAAELRDRYESGAEKVADMFEQYFTGVEP